MARFTVEQVQTMAPDASSVKAARGLANATRWQDVGADDLAVWGDCKGSGSKPYEVCVDLGNLAFQCTISADIPQPPLVRDLESLQKSLRLKAEAFVAVKDLDLRKDIDLGRSHLLHRLQLLGIPWGQRVRNHVGKGSFHEFWNLQWQPGFASRLIEASIWGGTVAQAATQFAHNRCNEAESLTAITALVSVLLLADLPEALDRAMRQLRNLAALGGDCQHLMVVLPPLVSAYRYGTVRRTDTGMLEQTIHGMVVRICIGLPGACHSLNDDAEGTLLASMLATHDALDVMNQPDLMPDWFTCLVLPAEQEGAHPLLAGGATRILVGRDEGHRITRKRLSRALSAANDPQQVAAWLEGFLGNAGMVLLHDDHLWDLVYTWVKSLSEARFVAVLPLLRRTFASFTGPERRGIGERVARGRAKPADVGAELDFDHERAAAVVPLVRQLMGWGVSS